MTLETDLYLGDFFGVAPGIPDDLAKITVTSPPYNMNLRISKTKRGYRHHSRQIVKENSTKYTNYADNLPLDEYLRFNCDALRECLRISPLVIYNIQFLTGNKSALFKMMGEFADVLKEVIVWDKTRAQPAVSESVLNSQFELLLVFDRSHAPTRRFTQSNFERGTLSNLWRVPPERKRHDGHRASFPEALVEKVLLNFSNREDRVFDPFMGTGTTGKVAREMGRTFTGVEIDADYYRYAFSRIASSKRPTPVDVEESVL